MFYAWFGIAKYVAGKAQQAYEYLCKARELGEKSGDQKAIGYACTWLTWTCAELGLLAEGTEFGNRAQKIADSFPSDQYLYFKSLAGLSYINVLRGKIHKVFECAKRLLKFGEETSNNRSLVFGHWFNSWGHSLTGDLKSAQKCSDMAVEVALDPFYSQFPLVTIAYSRLLYGQFQEAEATVQSLFSFCEPRAIGQITTFSSLLLAPILIATGNMTQGLRLLDEAQHTLNENRRRFVYALSENILGKIYSQIATGPKPEFSIIAKNIGFLLKNIPFAGKKAEEHFKKAIELIKEIEAYGFLGNAYLDLGLFYKAKKKKQQAREKITEAIKIFEECEAAVFLRQAKETLKTLKE